MGPCAEDHSHPQPTAASESGLASPSMQRIKASKALEEQDKAGSSSASFSGPDQKNTYNKPRERYFASSGGDNSYPEDVVKERLIDGVPLSSTKFGKFTFFFGDQKICFSNFDCQLIFFILNLRLRYYAREQVSSQP
jgi:hypothetical protein